MGLVIVALSLQLECDLTRKCMMLSHGLEAFNNRRPKRSEGRGRTCYHTARPHSNPILANTVMPTQRAMECGSQGSTEFLKWSLMTRV